MGEVEKQIPSGFIHSLRGLVEEDEVTFLVGAEALEEVAYRRFFVEVRAEPRLSRDAETEARLLEEIRAFFCERTGAASGV